MRDEIESALQREIGYFGGRSDRHAFDVDAFFVELAGNIAIALANQFEKGLWWGGNGRALAARWLGWQLESGNAGEKNDKE
jgi:hypothetical protein